MTGAVLRSVQCPQCAGPLGVTDANRLVVCQHCGVRVLVRETGGFTRWYFPCKVDRLGAVGVGSAWLKNYPDIKRGARKAQFIEATLLYAPIWEYRALVTGWETGARFRTELNLVGREGCERLDLQQVKKDVAEGRLGERRYYEEALDLSTIGVATRPLITGRELALPLLPGELEKGALQLEVNGTIAEIKEKGRKFVLTPEVGAIVYDSNVTALREKVALVYYPLWLLRFRDDERVYEMTVDGRAGTIFSAHAPASNNPAILRTAGELAFLAIVLAIVAHLLGPMGVGRFTIIGIAVVVSVAMLFTAAQLQRRREVEYHEPYSS